MKAGLLLTLIFASAAASAWTTCDYTDQPENMSCHSSEANECRIAVEAAQDECREKFNRDFVFENCEKDTCVDMSCGFTQVWGSCR